MNAVNLLLITTSVAWVPICTFYQKLLCFLLCLSYPAILEMFMLFIMNKSQKKCGYNKTFHHPHPYHPPVYCNKYSKSNINMIDNDMRCTANVNINTIAGDLPCKTHAETRWQDRQETSHHCWTCHGSGSVAQDGPQPVPGLCWQTDWPLWSGSDGSQVPPAVCWGPQTPGTIWHGRRRLGWPM